MIFPFVLSLLLAVDANALDLVTTGSVWRYLDDGSDQGTAWRQTGFDDTAWKSGPSQLGYGDGDEATVVGFGPNAGSKYITTYFRHAFQVSDLNQVGRLNLYLLKDDAAVVYINGALAHSSNMPAGTVNYLTSAASTVSSENTFEIVPLASNLFTLGTNVVAVEVHQAGGSSSDISFDLRLKNAGEADVLRGPYLQAGTATSIEVRWRTSTATDSRVVFGSAIDDLSQSVSDTAVVTDHRINLSGLHSNTKYYYSVGTTASILAGNDESYHFVTAPAYDAQKPTRIWVLGDSGTANSNAAAVKNAYMSYSGNTSPDVWLMLGDNAYNMGTDGEYQAAVFDMYPRILRQAVLWSTLGNHDAMSADSPSGTGVYYDVFSFPVNGEANGTVSGTQAYYAFDYSNIHFISLDSMDTDRSANGAMMTWLATDLSGTDKNWIIVFFHHPPYSKGSHDSDDAADSGGRLRDMREIFLPVLESYGVDMVLSGHSHAYERSYLVKGHFGSSATLSQDMILDGGDGRSSGDGAYDKTSTGNGGNGTIYSVVGSSGQVGGGSVNHPVMYIGLKTLGSMVIDVDYLQLDAVFLDSTGSTKDFFSISKAAPAGNVPPVADAGDDQIVRVGDSVQFDGSASADSDGSIVSYAWSNGMVGQKPTLTYDAAGDYDVQLVVTDNDGATATDSVIITVNAAAEIGDRTASTSNKGSGAMDGLLLLVFGLMTVRRSAFYNTV